MLLLLLSTVEASAMGASAAAALSPPCGPNPGNQTVVRPGGSHYPYFGSKCVKASDCGSCFTDETCTCANACCTANKGPWPKGYVCLPNATDIVGKVCTAKSVGAGKTLQQLADECDVLHLAGGIGCQGFNTNGFLKRCVRNSCGATLRKAAGQPTLAACVRLNTPPTQPYPHGSGPDCPGPGPKPPAVQPIPYAAGCAGSSSRTTCNCSGVHPPFSTATAHKVTLQQDYHFPAAEAAERAALMLPALVSAAAGSATLRNPATKATATLPVGASKWG